jgi:hypothetical protein
VGATTIAGGWLGSLGLPSRPTLPPTPEVYYSIRGYCVRAWGILCRWAMQYV